MRCCSPSRHSHRCIVLSSATGKPMGACIAVASHSDWYPTISKRRVRRRSPCWQPQRRVRCCSPCGQSHRRIVPSSTAGKSIGACIAVAFHLDWYATISKWPMRRHSPCMPSQSARELMSPLLKWATVFGFWYGTISNWRVSCSSPIFSESGRQFLVFGLQP